MLLLAERGDTSVNKITDYRSRDHKINPGNRIDFFLAMPRPVDSLCGLVVRVPGYRSRGPWFDSRRYQIF
jgi:hypothetical protein